MDCVVMLGHGDKTTFSAATEMDISLLVYAKGMGVATAVGALNRIGRACSSTEVSLRLMVIVISG
ncbi:hypothetical protein CKO42_05820 [Lamprobacter modestohalophilus]|uniref:Uncharacterized protein n=1 Tax=Lamprobacter modestohalophilus TaxID=1064514 RepID=A0A9X0W6M2_9GAMM|nr:hypothetical protein [Lamprobacter modestohalophilus]